MAHKSATEEKRRVYQVIFLLIFVKLSRIHFKRFTQEFMDKDKKGLAEVVDNNRRILKLTARN